MRSVIGGQVRNALTAIDDLIPVPWDLQVLIDRIAGQRGRPIRVVGVDIPLSARELTGAWWATQDVDFICYDQSASPAVREQTIAHELGHLLMDHRQRDGGSRPGVADVLAAASVNPTLIKNFLGRTGYDDAVEAAAEEFGTRLIQQGRRRRANGDAGALGRLTDSLR